MRKKHKNVRVTAVVAAMKAFIGTFGMGRAALELPEEVVAAVAGVLIKVLMK